MKPIVKMLVASWRRVSSLEDHLKLFNYGCQKYDFERSQKFNGKLKKSFSSKSEGSEMRRLITSFINSLLEKFEDIVLDAFIENWNEFCKYKTYPPTPNQLEQLEKLVIT